MIKRKIPRDISKYEAKLMLGLTTRQVVLFVPGAILAVIAFFLLKDTIGELAVLVAIVCAAPFILLAVVKPLGMPFEKFAKTAMIPLLLAPANRRYKTENTYASVLKTSDTIPVTKKNQKFTSKDPDHRAV